MRHVSTCISDQRLGSSLADSPFESSNSNQQFSYPEVCRHLSVMSLAVNAPWQIVKFLAFRIFALVNF